MHVPVIYFSQNKFFIRHMSSFQNFTAGENIFFQTDIKLLSNLELYSSLHETDSISFLGLSKELVDQSDLSLRHTHFCKNDKRIYFQYKEEADLQHVNEIIKNLEGYQTKTNHDLIGDLAIKNELPPLPAFYTPKKKKKSKKKKSKKTSANATDKQEEEEEPASEKKTKQVDLDPPIITSNFYNGLFLNPFLIATCTSARLPCGDCKKNNVEVICYDCSVFAALVDRRNTFFKGKEDAYLKTAIEHPWFFQQVFGRSVFQNQTRTPREQIVLAYSMLELIMMVIANPSQKKIGHTETWYKKSHQDRTEAFHDILEYERNHPLDLSDKSMNIRFQKLEEFIFTKFKYLVKNSQHEDSRRIADHKYQECKELNFDRQPAPYNNKLSEEYFRLRMDVEDGVKVVAT